MADDEEPPIWWSIPQAIVWIVTRSDTQTLRAGRASTLAQTLRMALGPTSHTKEPPASAKTAVDELHRGWQAGHIAISGRLHGKGPSRSVPIGTHLHIQDHRRVVCIGDASLYRGTSRFWSDLWVRADDCRRCWPAPPEQKAASSTPSHSAGFPSDDAVFAFLKDRRRAFRAEGKKAGREELIKAVMLRFRLQRKAALEIWNRAPHDRKGGRPKRQG
jgi:hypothetical protein